MSILLKVFLLLLLPAYDIIKARGGGIKVDSEDGEGTGFIILLPNQ